MAVSKNSSRETCPSELLLKREVEGVDTSEVSGIRMSNPPDVVSTEVAENKQIFADGRNEWILSILS